MSLSDLVMASMALGLTLTCNVVARLFKEYTRRCLASLPYNVITQLNGYLVQVNWLLCCPVVIVKNKLLQVHFIGIVSPD